MRTAFLVAGAALVAYIGYKLFAGGASSVQVPAVGPPQPAPAPGKVAATWVGANKPSTKVQGVIPPPLSVADQQKVLAAYAAHPELFPPGSKNYTALVQASTMAGGMIQ